VSATAVKLHIEYPKKTSGVPV